MPTPFPDDSILEVRFVGDVDGQQTINTFHYHVNLGGPDVIGTEGGFNDAAEAQIWEGWLRNKVAGAFKLVEIQSQIIHPTRFRYVGKTPNNQFGPDLGPTIVSGGCVVVRKLTDQAGRKNRGRDYFPAPILTDVSNSKLTDAGLASWTLGAKDALAADLTEIGGAIAHPIIWSPANPDFNRLVNEVKVDRIIRYQRRREVGVGV